MFVHGTHPDDWEAVRKLCATTPGALPAYGVHPWRVDGFSRDWLEALQAEIGRGPCLIGEIGLDRWIEPRDEALQEAVFRCQWELAAERQIPVTVHCLRAWGWLERLLRKLPTNPAGFILHSYGGPVEMVPLWLKQGAWLSFSGAVAEAKRSRARKACLATPLDRLLLETDAPAIPPPPEVQTFPLILDGQGQPLNEPAHLPAIGCYVAKLRGIEATELARQTWQNADGIWQRAKDAANRQSSPGRANPSGKVTRSPLA